MWAVSLTILTNKAQHVRIIVHHAVKCSRVKFMHENWLLACWSWEIQSEVEGEVGVGMEVLASNFRYYFRTARITIFAQTRSFSVHMLSFKIHVGDDKALCIVRRESAPVQEKYTAISKITMNDSYTLVILLFMLCLTLFFLLYGKYTTDSEEK